MGEGVPLRAICRTPGLPSRDAVYDWRRADSEFDRQCRFMTHEGYINLLDTVSRELERIVQDYPPKVARRVFNLRRRQLIQVNPRFFGGP